MVGASFALKKLGIPFKCVGYSEIDKVAIKCYDQNHEPTINFGNCTTIDPATLPNFNLLTGGFPCQDVSIAGLQDLSKGRTTLFSEIIRIAEVKKPKYMLLENVKGLTFKKNSVFFEHCLSEMKRIGYDVKFKVLNSRHYGIPQNRERIYFVCKLGKWKKNEFNFPTKTKLYIKLKNILEEEVGDEFYLNQNDLDYNYKHGLTRNKNIYKSNVNREYGLCQTCSTSKRSCDVDLIKDDKGFRLLTPTEAFRKMGFLNDEINLDDISNTRKYKLAGNGWEINIISILFNEMFKERRL